jgi:LuxR family transcriptional regulator
MQFHLTLDRQRVIQELQAEARRLGFEHFACGIRIPLHPTRPQFILLNSYPSAWQARYEQADYLSRDPTVEHARNSPQPLSWGDAQFECDRELWEDACSHGIRYGWSQSLFDPRGVGVMVTLARSHEPLAAMELAAKDGLLRALASQVFQRLYEALEPAPRGWLKKYLTPQQLRVLQWTAEGKTCVEIARIMGCSEWTARYHVLECLSRLDAPNKTAAAVRGWVLGAYA